VNLSFLFLFFSEDIVLGAFASSPPSTLIMPVPKTLTVSETPFASARAIRRSEVLFRAG